MYTRSIISPWYCSTILSIYLTVDPKSKLRAYSNGNFSYGYVFDSIILIRLFTIASSYFSTGIGSFSALLNAKFSFIHIFACPSLFIPIMFGRALKYPSFWKRTFKPDATFLKIKKPSALLNLPIYSKRCILSVITYNCATPLHMPGCLNPYSYKSTTPQSGKFYLHLQRDIT